MNELCEIELLVFDSKMFETIYCPASDGEAPVLQFGEYGKCTWLWAN